MNFGHFLNREHYLIFVQWFCQEDIEEQYVIEEAF